MQEFTSVHFPILSGLDELFNFPEMQDEVIGIIGILDGTFLVLQMNDAVGVVCCRIDHMSHNLFDGPVLTVPIPVGNLL